MKCEIRYKGKNVVLAYMKLQDELYLKFGVIVPLDKVKRLATLKHTFLLTGESVYVINIEL